MLQKRLEIALYGRNKKGMAILIDSYALFNIIQKIKKPLVSGPVVEAFTDPKL